MKVRFTQSARIDLQVLLWRIAADNAGAAVSVSLAIKDALVRIAERDDFLVRQMFR